MHKFGLNKQIVSLALLFSFFGLVFYSSAKASSQDLFYQPFLGQIHAINTLSGNSQVKIAIIDEGIDFTQADLKNTDSGNRWNFLFNSDDLTPQGSHGTQVAGAILAADQNNKNIKFMNLIACSQSEGCDMKAIIDSIYYAADHGAQVINLSFTVADQQGYLDQFTDAISYAYHKNIVIVAASGNGDLTHRAFNLDTHPLSPVCNDGLENMVLGVSAISDNDSPVSWANFGSCVDVSAPGNNIYTTLSPIYNGGSSYGYKSGTSYAAPIVSALAAEILTINNTLTSRQVMDTIINHASPLNFSGYGSGVVNFNSTLSAVSKQPQISTAEVIINVPKKPKTTAVKKAVAQKSPATKLYIRGPY